MAESFWTPLGQLRNTCASVSGVGRFADFAAAVAFALPSLAFARGSKGEYVTNVRCAGVAARGARGGAPAFRAATRKFFCGALALALTFRGAAAAPPPRMPRPILPVLSTHRAVAGLHTLVASHGGHAFEVVAAFGVVAFEVVVVVAFGGPAPRISRPILPVLSTHRAVLGLHTLAASHGDGHCFGAITGVVYREKIHADARKRPAWSRPASKSRARPAGLSDKCRVPMSGGARRYTTSGSSASAQSWSVCTMQSTSAPT